jgi:hypothetical protein
MIMGDYMDGATFDRGSGELKLTDRKAFLLRAAQDGRHVFQWRDNEGLLVEELAINFDPNTADGSGLRDYLEIVEPRSRQIMHDNPTASLEEPISPERAGVLAQVNYP